MIFHDNQNLFTFSLYERFIRLDPVRRRIIRSLDSLTFRRVYRGRKKKKKRRREAEETRPAPCIHHKGFPLARFPYCSPSFLYPFSQPVLPSERPDPPWFQCPDATCRNQHASYPLASVPEFLSTRFSRLFSPPRVFCYFHSWAEILRPITRGNSQRKLPRGAQRRSEKMPRR